jgi:hypothetical protein
MESGGVLSYGRRNRQALKLRKENVEFRTRNRRMMKYELRHSIFLVRHSAVWVVFASFNTDMATLPRVRKELRLRQRKSQGGFVDSPWRSRLLISTEPQG